jgi:hypothetical protein
VAGTGPVRVDAFRRNLQRAWIETLADRVNGRQSSSDDARALFRQELRLLDASLKASAPRAADGVTRAHLADVRSLIARALDPTVQAAATAAARPASDSLSGEGADPFAVNESPSPDVCWPDYAIGSAQH